MVRDFAIHAFVVVREKRHLNSKGTDRRRRRRRRRGRGETSSKMATMSTELYTDIETNSTLSTGIWKSAAAAAAAPWERISWGMALGFLLVSYVVYEQLTFMWKRKHLPGPMFVLPFLGGVIPMIVNPTQFWDDQAVAAKKVKMRNIGARLSTILFCFFFVLFCFLTWDISQF